MAFKMAGFSGFKKTIAKDKSFEKQLENSDNQSKFFEQQKKITLKKLTGYKNQGIKKEFKNLK